MDSIEINAFSRNFQVMMAWERLFVDFLEVFPFMLISTMHKYVFVCVPASSFWIEHRPQQRTHLIHLDNMKVCKNGRNNYVFFPFYWIYFQCICVCVFLRWQLTNYGPSQKTNVCAVVQMAQQTDKIASILLSLVTQFFFFFFFFTLLEIYRIDFWPIEKFSLLSRRLFIYWDWKCFSKTNKRNCENL